MFIFNFVDITTSKYLVVVFHIVHYEPDAPTTDHGTAGRMGTLVEVLYAITRMHSQRNKWKQNDVWGEDA